MACYLLYVCRYSIVILLVVLVANMVPLPFYGRVQRRYTFWMLAQIHEILYGNDKERVQS